MNGSGIHMTGEKRKARLAVLLVFALLLTAPKVLASGKPAERVTVDPVGHNDNYSAVLYDNTNGLPTSEANDIAQTSDGFIWIGSYSGLIRYDGNTFERMDSTTGISNVVKLFVDRQDRLWIGTNDNGVALKVRDGYRVWRMEDGLGSDKICAIGEDANGTLYIGTTGGVSMMTRDMKLHLLDDPRIAGAYIERMDASADGLMHCTTNEDDYFTLRSGDVVEYFDHNETGVQGITSFFCDRDDPGKLYIGTEGSAVYHGDPSEPVESMQSTDISPLFSAIDVRMFGDQLWVCASNGIGVIDSGGFHHLAEFPMDSSVGTVMADYEGNLWFTSTRQGVMKVVSNQFSDLFGRFDLPQSVVNGTCMYRGDLYIGTDNGLMVLSDSGLKEEIPVTEARTASGGELETEDLLQLLDACRIRSVYRDSKDRLWFSTWRSAGLICYDDGKVTAFHEADGLLSDHIRIVTETHDGAILVACTGGMNVIRDGRVTESFSREDGILNQESLTVCEAPNGDILLGSNGGGIYVISDSGTRCIGTDDGLTSGVIMRIKYDPELQVFWLVTSNSLAYMTTDYRVTTVENFPYANNFDLYKNKSGDMWILSSDGIYVTPAQELIANGEIKPVHYGIRSGMPCIATSNSYSELTADGDLYIAGNTGVAKVNIDTPMEDVGSIRQVIPYIDADGQRIYPDEDGGFRIPAGARRVTIYGYVFNYSLTDPQVTYHMEGFDRESVTVNRSELGPVTYTNLPGGTYRFMMELSDAMGRGGNTLSVQIIKEKALHEQTWLYVLIGIAAALLVSGIVRAYIDAKTRKMEKRHQENVEKERMASQLNTASRIQESVLPHTFPPFPDRTEFDLYASMNPALSVGGDFYDFYLIDEDHLGLVVADVSGKGIPAALFMMVSKAILKNSAMLGSSAADILEQTNDMICSNNQVDMFVTVWLGILEISTGRVRAANVGHEYPALMQNGKFSLMKDRHGFVIGGMEGMKYTEYEFTLQPGDKLFVYTDGVTEATTADQSMFGTDRMLDALNIDPKASPELILRNVKVMVDSFVGDAEQFDDLTMLCLEYRGKQ